MENRVKTLIKSGLAVVALSLCLSGNALAGKFEEGVAAFSVADYATAYRLWLPFAKQGNASAQLGLGGKYDQGQGVMQNYAEAVKWYRMAAEQGNALA